MSTAAQIRAIRQVEPGKSPAAIADELEVSRQYVSSVLKRAGMPSDFRSGLPHRTRPGGAKPFAEREPFGQVLDLLDLSNEPAADLLGVHPVTVAKYANGTIKPPKAVSMFLHVALGLGLETARAAMEAGNRKRLAAVDAARADATT